MKKTRKLLRHWTIPVSAFVFGILLFIDQYTKHVISTGYAIGESTTIFSWLWFTYLQNTGANWGIMQNNNTLFIFLSIVAFAVLVYYAHDFRTPVERLSYAAILAGLWGNLLDRVTHGFVIDFIDLGWWPVFNVADSAILVGIFVYLFHQWRKARKA
ncbi:MAG: signal peptidase II [Candidatus Woesearchaeota archaeon]|nr:signal peptidase II [Candidatus Woesearchaeota archaeon]